MKQKKRTRKIKENEAAVAELPTSFESPESSTIASASYDPLRLELTITFHYRQRPYLYGGISGDLWAGFVMASSKGKYFSDMIRPLYLGRPL